MGRPHFAKILLLTFLLAISVPIALAIVSRSPGMHSAAGVLLLLIGMPGSIVGSWAARRFGYNHYLGYLIVIAAVNFAFYLCVVKAVMLLKTRLRRAA